MKIDFSAQLLKSSGFPQAGSAKIPESQSFKSVLREQLNGSESAAPKISSFCPTAEVVPVDTDRFSAESVTKGIEGLLDSMEAYRQKLADPGVSNEELAPAVERLKSEQEALEPALDGMKSEDSLKTILAQSLQTVAAEVIRYARGAYQD